MTRTGYGLVPGCALVTAVTLAALASCASRPMSDDWIEARPLARHVATYHPPSDVEHHKDAAPTFEPPTGRVTLADAVAAALLHNPDLQSFGWAVRAAEARTVQADLWPNPVAGLVSENLGGPKNVSIRNTIRLSQVIELGDKRTKRVELAESDRRLAAWDYEQARIRVVTEVARRHIASLAAQRRVQLARRTLELAQQVHKIVDDRVKAGVVPTSERAKAVVRVSSERIRLYRAERQLASSRQSLAAAWGSDDVTFDAVVGDFDHVTALPNHDDVLAKVDQNPRIARWDDEIEHRRRAIDLAKARGVPDVTAGVGVRHFADTNDAAVVVEFSSPLPIVDRNQGRVLEARYDLARAVTRKRAAEVAVHDELVRHLEDLAAAHYETVTLGNETLPAAREAFNAASEAFTQGRTDYLDVLDAERTLVDIEQQMLDAVESYHQQLNAVEGLVAMPIARL